MRIAQIAPLYEAVPPRLYGGTERVIAALCDGLVGLGHEVTLFAAGGSDTCAELVAVTPAPLRAWMSRDELTAIAPHLHLRMLRDVYQRADEFDLIHSHADIWTLPFTASSNTPTLITLHGRLDVPEARHALEAYPDVPLVSISDAQRLPLLDTRVTWAGTVPNGLDLSSYHAASSRTERGRHLAFVGRINPEKGPETAVEVAVRTGRRLRVAAKVDPFDVEYYSDVVDPLFRASRVDFVGEIGEADKPTFLASAAATLFPSDWPEPFGLVMIESMAAGTPVIALRRGSIPEVIVDGVTGFICDDVDEMVDAVDRLDEIDPDECRRHVANFDARSMTARYAAIYAELVGSPIDRPLDDARRPPAPAA